MVKVLVVGGAGYIGSHVVKALLQSGHRVTVYDNLSSGQKINLFSEAGFVEADILDFAALDKAMAGQEAVVHLAAKKPSANRWKTGTLCRKQYYRFTEHYEGDAEKRCGKYGFFFVGGGLRNAGISAD